MLRQQSIVDDISYLHINEHDSLLYVKGSNIADQRFMVSTDVVLWCTRVEEVLRVFAELIGLSLLNIGSVSMNDERHLAVSCSLQTLASLVHDVNGTVSVQAMWNN